MICGKLDSELMCIAKRFRCTYSRYADDITFSTTKNRIPNSLGRLNNDDESTKAVVGDMLNAVIETNGFTINHDKTRIQGRGTRQEVTGLIVNKAPNVTRRYIRQLRAMIHAVKKYGPDAADLEFKEKYYKKQIRSDKAKPHILVVLRGKLNYIKMVKGESDVIYRKLFNQLETSLGGPKKYLLDPLKDVVSALWVLESEEEVGQGTAFMLKGYGLITCSHVLKKGTKAFKHEEPHRKYEITVLHKNDDLDVAILGLKCDAVIELEVGDPKSVKQGDRLILSGFPNYRIHDTDYRTEARVAGFRIVTMQRWILINGPIVAGNSGGPVLNQNGKVIGIAATGADSMDDAHKTEHHGVIPITVLDNLMK